MKIFNNIHLQKNIVCKIIKCLIKFINYKCKIFYFKNFKIYTIRIIILTNKTNFMVGEHPIIVQFNVNK